MKEKQFFVEKDGVQLEVLDIHPQASPNGPAVVFLHDALGSIAQWQDFPRLVAGLTQRRTIVYNRRGHGRSSPLQTPRRPDYLHREALKDLPSLLDHLEISAPILIGHSDGGSIALIYAAHHPTTALITEAAHVIVEDITLRGIRMAARDRFQLIQALKKYHDERAQVLFDAWTETWLHPDFRDWDITGLLPRIECPALIIQGADDEYGSEEQVWAISAGIGPRSQAILIANCGHIPHREAPTKIIDHMTKFIVDYSRD